MRRFNVLFVCTGNICRSPTAEAVFRACVEKAGLANAITVDSAGTHGYHVGDAPDPRAIEHGRRRGYDLSRLRARRIDGGDFENFDLLIACDRGHHKILKRLAPPDAGDRVVMFLDYAPELGLSDVPDPYYGSARDFEHVLDLVERAADGLLTAVKQKLS